MAFSLDVLFVFNLTDMMTEDYGIFHNVDTDELVISVREDLSCVMSQAEDRRKENRCCPICTVVHCICQDDTNEYICAKCSLN